VSKDLPTTGFWKRCTEEGETGEMIGDLALTRRFVLVRVVVLVLESGRAE
jgi:hypothetical protein